MAGISCCVALTIAYLMRRMQSAYQYVNDRRPAITPNLNSTDQFTYVCSPFTCTTLHSESQYSVCVCLFRYYESTYLSSALLGNSYHKHSKVCVGTNRDGPHARHRSAYGRDTLMHHFNKGIPHLTWIQQDWFNFCASANPSVIDLEKLGAC